MNQKNPLGLNSCFLDLDDPIQLFKVWMEEAKKSEPNDPNAVSLATSNKKNLPSVRIVLLKDFSQNGFVFYTNLNSQKGNELKENPNVNKKRKVVILCFIIKILKHLIQKQQSSLLGFCFHVLRVRIICDRHIHILKNF